MSDEQPNHLRLIDALVRWGEQKLVECVRQEERKLTAYELHSFSRPKLTPPDEWAQPSNGRWLSASDCTFLLAAWEALEADFARRIEIGELYLEGVRSTTEPDAQPEAIPNAWAAELVFDFGRNTVMRGDRRYLSVTVSQTPSPWSSLDQVGSERSGPPTQITETTVRELSDEEVLILLEDHARRVVESKEYQALDPGITKVSFMPLILRKMRARAAAGELFDTLSAEAGALENWIQGKAPSHQTPTAGAIENSLRNPYKLLKP